MRILRIGTIAVFLLTSLIFSIFYINEQNNIDKTYPYITIDNPLLEVSLKADETELMQGVTAYDEKDGDLTDYIVIESISNFIEPGLSNITYAVSDSNNNVYKVTRIIRYIDYKKPRFYMKNDFVYTLSEMVNLLNNIGAVDVIDGDISDKVVITATNFEAGKVGIFRVLAKVSNSKGDTVYLDLPVSVEDRGAAAPKIILSEYLIYTEIGNKIDPYEYVESVINSQGDDLIDELNINFDVNINEIGVYQIDYYVKDDIGREGHTILTVVIEGEE